MDYLISSALGYLIGSIPTAYIILKRKGIDVTKKGSGNVGAMNSYEITGSGYTGLAVFTIDFVKGLLPVLFFSVYFSKGFSISAISLLFAIFSHCFNPWIKFNGGRGLATASGGILVLFYPLLVCWILLWGLIFIVKKNILAANIFATSVSLILSLLFAKYFLNLATPQPVLLNELLLFISAGLILIFIKHIEPLKEIILNQSKKNDK